MSGADKVIKQMRTKSQHAIWELRSRRVDYGVNEANAPTDETREAMRDKGLMDTMKPFLNTVAGH